MMQSAGWVQRVAGTTGRRLPVGPLLLALALSVVAVDASAQAAAEYAGTAAAATSVGATTDKKISFPASAKKNSKFRHLPSGISESPAAANRRALEENAGEDAGSLLLRSTPKGARVWIDGKLVGETPLLLVLAPGTYKVEIRGTRMGVKEETIDLLAEEKREVLLTLASRYPSELRLE